MAFDVNAREYNVVNAGGDKVTIDIPASTTDYNMTLPAVKSAGGVLMDANGDLRIARITTAFWHTQNGYGSTNNKIQKFTTEVDASDDVVVTVVNSATLGFSVTANMACKLFLSYSSTPSLSSNRGISKNSTQLTTTIAAISASNRITITTVNVANQFQTAECYLSLESGDVVRPHTDGASDGTAPERSSISILAEEI